MGAMKRQLDPEVRILADRNRTIIRSKAGLLADGRPHMQHSKFWTARVMLDDMEDADIDDRRPARHRITLDPKTGNRR